MDLELDGRVAIVTGASRGLGSAIVEALVAEGMKVMAAARSEGPLEALQARYPGQVAAHRYDARDADAAGVLVEATVAAFGGLDVLVNNAGIAPAGRFAEMSLDQFRDVLEVNVMGPVALTQAAGIHMLRQERGKVINIASLTGLRGKARLSSYSASKAALVRFTEAVAAEWAPRIQVNVIAPGAFRTEAQHEVLESEDLLKRRIARIPSKRFAEPGEIGPLVCYLASPASDFVTGASFAIDGGELGKL
jgi:2-dehydro-3-deoxy-D-gluconate 5-dehydrogenase